MPEREGIAGKQLCPCGCHWDLGWLRFRDTRIAFSDVDGLFVVERKGRFLFLETKGVDEPLWRGQVILLSRLSHVAGFTVMVVRGPKQPGIPTSIPATFQVVRRGIWYQAEATSKPDFQARIDAWYDAASQAKPVHRLDRVPTSGVAQAADL